MKVYLDTTVVSVQIFGGFSEQERERHSDVQTLFAKIDSGEIDAIVSFYVLQELYTICAELSDAAELETFAREVLLEILRRRIGVFRLLTREERLVHRHRFTIRDPSDEPHVISALLSGCDAIVTYDTHFDDVRDLIPVYTPTELMASLSGDSTQP
jgi:predicted nucleic acid-binding protein